MTPAEEDFLGMPVIVYGGIPGCRKCGGKGGVLGGRKAHLLLLVLVRNASELLRCLWVTYETWSAWWLQTESGGGEHSTGSYSSWCSIHAETAISR